MTDQKQKAKFRIRKSALTLTACGVLLGSSFAAVGMRDDGTHHIAAHHGTLSSCITDFNEASARPTRWEDLQQRMPDAHGEPVLIVPGFLGNDFYMSSLESTLSNKGYTTYGWEQGINTGPSPDAAAGLLQKLQDIYKTHGQAKVSIVGYSLGGVYARELARAYPDMVQSVITLGAPFAMDDTRTAEIQTIYAGQRNSAFVSTQTAPPVPTTSLYSKGDWVVNYQYSLHGPGTAAEDIEIHGGHIMMPFSKEAATITLCQLAKAAPRPKP